MASNSENAPTFATTDLADVRRIHVATQDRRYDLITDILGHPQGRPSLSELDFMNPPVARTTIQEHLERLIEVGVVEAVQIPVGERSRDLPYVFYGLSEGGAKLLDDHGLLGERDAWQDLYARVEKSETIQRYENAPRPSSD